MKTRLLLASLAVSGFALSQPRPALPIPAAGNVTLSLQDYNQLVERAALPAPKPDTPLAYSLRSAELRLQAAGELVSGTVQIDGEVFSAKTAVKVPLVSGMTVFNAQQQGKDLPLEQESGRHAAILSGPAPFSVTLNAGLPLSTDAGRASFLLPAPAAGTVRLTLVVPGERTNINLTPGLITSRTSANGQTTIVGVLVPGQPAALSWATREMAPPVVPREVRFLSDLKTLVSVTETGLELAVLADITVVQGTPSQFELELPAGYEVTGATGNTLSTSDVQSGLLMLKVVNASQRTHEFLISLERAFDGTKTEAPILSFKGAQRETGEVLIEGAGTMELAATEGGGLQRMDLKEINPYLRALAQFAPQAAFRYHRQPGETPRVSLEWARFPDARLLAAVVQRATVTTLVTSEGRSLTEIKLLVRNQAQPFLRLALPAGATIVSAEVAGQAVKPVQGADGSRVPLLRTGFRPTGSYPVSFVFLHSGAPFARKGGAELTLPRMDVPVGLMQWEVFLPQQYKVADFGGDVVPAALLGLLPRDGEEIVQASIVPLRPDVSLDLGPGQVGGVVVDPSGAVIAGARVTVLNLATGNSQNVTADRLGRWVVMGMPSGRLRITVSQAGFQIAVREGEYDANQPLRFDTVLNVGSVTESVTLNAESANLALQSTAVPKDVTNAPAPPSSNVTHLQKRVAGVLPIRVDVPRDGNSYRFMRPLVIDEETKVTFRYKSR